MSENRENPRRDPHEIIPVPLNRDEALIVEMADMRLFGDDPEFNKLAAEVAKRPKIIKGEQVEWFCGPCDNYGDDGICTMTFGRENQPRYVSRLWCGVAEVKGSRGNMTVDGFVPSDSIKHPLE